MSDRADHRQTLLVSFSGIDGAGKSTQIDFLRERLQSRGLRVKLLRFWDDIAVFKSGREATAFKLFKGDKGIGAPNAPIQRRDKNVRSPLMTCVRLVIYFLDTLSLRATVRRAKRDQVDIIICDRYIYDEITNFNLQNSLIRLYSKMLLAAVPSPDVGFVIDADPVAAHIRKPEYPIEFVKSNRESYLRLSDLTRVIQVIPPSQVEDAKAEVWKCITAHFPECLKASGDTNVHRK